MHNYSNTVTLKFLKRPLEVLHHANDVGGVSAVEHDRRSRLPYYRVHLDGRRSFQLEVAKQEDYIRMVLHGIYKMSAYQSTSTTTEQIINGHFDSVGFRVERIALGLWTYSVAGWLRVLSLRHRS